jgi:YidC/Oxa1 family membrane protein insertase
LAEYHSPQQPQEPGSERKLLLAFVVTFLIIMGIQPLLQKYGPRPPQPTPAASQPAAVAASPAAATPPSASGTPRPSAASAKTVQASSETETVIENDFYRIRFSNRGGLVKSWVLKHYDDDQGQPLELAGGAAAEKYGFPLSLYTYDAGLRGKINSVLYVASRTGTQSAGGDLAFEYSDAEVAVRKTYHFDASYVVRVETAVRYRGQDVQAYPSWPAGFAEEKTIPAFAAAQVEYQNQEKIERLDVKKVSGGNTVNGPLHWAGVADRYFAAVFMPEDPQNAALVTLRDPLDVAKDPQKPGDTTKVDVLGAAVGDRRGPTTVRLYVGPKSLEVIEKLPAAGATGAAADLTGLVNFGFFGIIAKPLFLWLKWMYHNLVANWGWAIVLQTIIINLVLLPLRLSQMKSALKMQKAAPQIKAIQEKYKKYTMRDPRKQEMNQEMSALYKREGVNPVGGCLPLVIQMPFLFAYYSMLSAVIDLRHARWLWVRDLSSPDPYYLLPIAILVSMFLVQRMTPQGVMDPQQQKMMNIMMPLFIGYMSLNLAAGLCLYWAMGNIISIVQQKVMNRTSLGREMREMAMKRARRKEK